MQKVCVAGKNSVNSTSYYIPENFTIIICAASQITEYYSMPNAHTQDPTYKSYPSLTHRQKKTFTTALNYLSVLDKFANQL